ncbi:MAG: hypothetical protein OFPII_29900 [Osedax symbiont Rs1]|nr:MAG: hypothetical protein OFPII_29900 [Osedax symbiont Rs1]
MWIVIFEEVEQDAEELLNRLKFMFDNIKRHRDKKTNYDARIIIYLNAWGLNHQDDPNLFLDNTDRIWRQINTNLDFMRKGLGDQKASSAIAIARARAVMLGSLVGFLEEALHLRWPPELDS